MSTPELLNLLIKSVDDVKTKLDKIDERLRNVESSIAESKGKTSGLVTAKDIFIVLCAIGALVISFFRLTQN